MTQRPRASITVAGQVRFSVAGATTIVSVDSNGDRIADVEIEPAGAVALDRADFVLVETDDVLLGYFGNDRLVGLAGDDVLDGGEDVDTADYSAGKAITVDLAITGAQNTNAGKDTLISIENLIGSTTMDRFFGNAAANRFDGGAGNDTFDGRGGDDVLIGGAGIDYMTGGAGAFTRVAGQLRTVTNASRTDVIGDVDGDGRADFSFLLMNRAIPTAGDFVL